MPLELTELDLDSARGRRRRDRRLPARRLRADGRRAARRSACSSSTSPPTSACATCRPTSAGTGEHGAPELLEDAVYGLTELYRDELREAELVATPGCYPTASVLALAPLAERGLLADVVVDAKQGISGAGRSSDDTVHFTLDDRERLPLQDRGPPPPARDRAGAGRARQPGAGHLRPAPAAARPGRAGDLLRDAHASRSRRRRSQALYARALRAASRSSTSLDGPPDLRAVRDTNECHVYVTVEERGRVLAFAAIDNLWKGASGQGVQNLNLMLGLDETEGLL